MSLKFAMIRTCLDEIVCLFYHLPYLSFPEKNRGVNVKNEFSMTFDIQVYYMRIKACHAASRSAVLRRRTKSLSF